MILGIHRLEDNLFDLRAQVVSNQRGIIHIVELIEQYSLDLAQAYMMHVQINAEVAMREMMKSVVS